MNRVLCPTWYSQFRDEFLQAIKCTRTNQQTHNNQEETQKMHNTKLAKVHNAKITWRTRQCCWTVSTWISLAHVRQSFRDLFHSYQHASQACELHSSCQYQSVPSIDNSQSIIILSFGYTLKLLTTIWTTIRIVNMLHCSRSNYLQKNIPTIL